MTSTSHAGVLMMAYGGPKRHLREVWASAQPSDHEKEVALSNGLVSQDG
jgi:hypothetical protein